MQVRTYIYLCLKHVASDCLSSDEKSFLFEIVANKTNGIDVDKFDYIARDTRAIGDNQNISLTRYGPLLLVVVLAN